MRKILFVCLFYSSNYSADLSSDWTDIYCNRYNCIKVSIILLSVSSLTGLGIAVAALVITEMQPSLLIHTTISSLGVVLVTAVIIVVLFSLGMFEAVGIQFGMDQMVEASSDQISAFTHNGTTGV